jgi:predicted TIM-barrel fold metal-dependent hydrolase
MASFIFSADGHIIEPQTLFTDALPPSLRDHGLHAEARDNHMFVMAGKRVISKMALNRPQPKLSPDGQEPEQFGRANRLGARDIAGRLIDMEHEGIDAEICFPSAGLFAFLIDDPEAELATAQVYNDWNNRFFGAHQEKFVRCGLLPVRDLRHTVAEIERLAGMGYTAAMLPSLIDPAIGLRLYNDEAWDPVFEAGQNHRVVFVLHTGTGREDVRAQKGPGGAVINYTIQMCDSQHSLMHLVGGGILDRFPGAKVACIESGASWLAALAERMDEVYEAHHMFVRPKLSLTPREIIRRQVHASFQYDRACIMSRSVTGHQALMWGADYPHHEGTFPRSRNIVAHLFDGIEISEGEKSDILGGNAARLFRLPLPEFAEAA